MLENRPTSPSSNTVARRSNSAALVVYHAPDRVWSMFQSPGMVDRSAVLDRLPLRIPRKHNREKAPSIEGASVCPNLQSHRHQWLRPGVLEWGEFGVFA